ncbi:MAG: GNAT family N-acetyltransferase [Spirochaetaceae bacterium]|nr:GNAT family N-acetyltransferase [Spirochaetaceae bacterium]
MDDSPQLRMVWPAARLDSVPPPTLPAGYTLRTHRPGDEARFHELMELAGWPGWDDDRLSYSLNRMLPDGWFMAVHSNSAVIVASAMALHNYKGTFPFWGELGWLAADPAHSGHGLGMAVSACVVRRFVDAGYRHIHLHTEHYRLAAIKTYLKLGFAPWIDGPDGDLHWAPVLDRLGWPAVSQP